MQNGSIESFNGRFREECLDQSWFTSLAEARRIIEAWGLDYNEHRPHTIRRTMLGVGQDHSGGVRSDCPRSVGAFMGSVALGVSARGPAVLYRTTTNLA